MEHPEQLPAADHPGLRLRGQLRPAHPRAAARRHLPHLPRGAVTRDRGPSARSSRRLGALLGPLHRRRRSRAPGSSLFLAGCPLRCLYCQNPDTWHMRDGRATTVDDVMAEIAARTDAFIAVAGGGVTVSGGEPLLQPAFTGALLRRVPASRACTPPWTPPGSSAPAPTTTCSTTPTWCCSTSSPGTRRTYRRRHRRASSTPTLAFARRLADLGHADLDPVRPGARPHRRPGQRRADGRLRRRPRQRRAGRRPAVPPARRAKYDALGLPFPLADRPAPTVEQAESVREIFRSRGLVVT